MSRDVFKEMILRGWYDRRCEYVIVVHLPPWAPTCAVVPTCWADVGRGTHMMSRRALRYPHDERTCAVVPTCWQDVRRGTHIASPETPGEPSIRNFPACSETIDTVFRAYTNMNGCTLNPVPICFPALLHIPSSRLRRAFWPRLVVSKSGLPRAPYQPTGRN